MGKSTAQASKKRKQKIKVKVDFYPHAQQQAIERSKARFKVVVAGRRGGKTCHGLNSLFKKAMEVPALYWWTAPTYRIGILPKWEEFCATFKDFIEYKNESDHRMRLISGAHIDWLSLEKYHLIRGEGPKHIFVDEAAQCREAAWTEVLRPSLMDKQGGATFQTTPKGRNWLWKMFIKGQSEDHPEYASFHYPSHANPYLSPIELDKISKDLTEVLYRQEILAEFLEDELAAIRNVDECATAETGKVPQSNRTYVAGVDLGRKQDWTVVTVFDITTGVPVEVEIYRRNHIGWDVLIQGVAHVCKKWRAKALVDSTGIGDVVIPQLQSAGVQCEPYVFTPQSKRDLCENLIIRFDRKEVAILKDELANNEMKAFEMIQGRTGNISYGHPEGMHDDCVIARALALWQARSGVARVSMLMPDSPVFQHGGGFFQ